jgi:hypothetical protein
MATKFRDDDGRLTAYALACGDVEQYEIGDRHVWTLENPQLSGRQVTLWEEHGVYHVRHHDFERFGRISWSTHTKLSAARRYYDAACRAADAGNEEYQRWLSGNAALRAEIKAS